jgi:hypothetical protein
LGTIGSRSTTPRARGAGAVTSRYQRTKLALRLEEAIAARAKANSGHRSDLPQKSAEGYKPVGETREEIAKLAGVSRGGPGRNPAYTLLKAKRPLKPRFGALWRTSEQWHPLGVFKP